MILKLENCTIELLIDDSNLFLGLGAIEYNGVSLKNALRPGVCRLDTADGIVYPEMILEKVTECNKGYDVELLVKGFQTLRMEYQDDYQQSQVADLSTKKIFDKVKIIFRPIDMNLENENFSGFSYAFEISSQSGRKFHRFMTDFTWEIGGKITDNTILNQGQCNMPVYSGSKESIFTTTCLNRLSSYGDRGQISYQLGLRGGLSQAFDFQYSKEGVLFNYFDDPQSLVCSWQESGIGEDVLHVVDEYRFEQTEKIVLGEKKILFLPGNFTEQETRDLWFKAHSFVYGKICQAFGISQTPVTPAFHKEYGSSFNGFKTVKTNDWISKKSDNSNKKLIFHMPGTDIQAHELLDYIKDEQLPILAKQGIKRFMPMVISESDVTVSGEKRKLDMGIQGDLHCASVCATHRFFPSDFFGGISAWNHMYEKAKSLGIDVWHWFAPHYSPRSPYLIEHPEWNCIGPSTNTVSGGYTTATLAPVNWNSGIYEATLQDIKKWHNEGGLDGLFIDSFSNLGTAHVNFSENMKPNFQAFGNLLHDFQKIGLKHFSFEGIGLWGMGNFGVMDVGNDLNALKGAVPGQNNFAWWIDNEDMLLNSTIVVNSTKRSLLEMKQSAFRAFASGGAIYFDNEMKQSDEQPEWRQSLNHIYNQVCDEMQLRKVLSNNNGVIWRNDKSTSKILWNYKERNIDFSANKIILISQAKESLLTPEDKLLAYNVYRIIK